MKFIIYVLGAIVAIVAAHFVIKWLEGDYVAETPRKEIGPQVDSKQSAPIDIESCVVPT